MSIQSFFFPLSFFFFFFFFFFLVISVLLMPVLSVFYGRYSQFFSVFFNVIFESLYRCIDVILNAGGYTSSFFGHVESVNIISQM